MALRDCVVHRRHGASIDRAGGGEANDRTSGAMSAGSLARPIGTLAAIAASAGSALIRGQLGEAGRMAIGSRLHHVPGVGVGRVLKRHSG